MFALTEETDEDETEGTGRTSWSSFVCQMIRDEADLHTSTREILGLIFS